MIVLAADTSTMTTSVAVVETGNRIRSAGRSVATPASDNLMPLIQQALADAGIELVAIDGFAIGAGPGSFTGLRIGMATLKGLAFATGKPIWAVSSLEALAMSVAIAGAGEPILVGRGHERHARGGLCRLVPAARCGSDRGNRRRTGHDSGRAHRLVGGACARPPGPWSATEPYCIAPNSP